MRRTIAIKPGDKYSTAEIDSASAALTDLEVFSSVRIVPQLTDPPPANRVVPLVVTVIPPSCDRCASAEASSSTH